MKLENVQRKRTKRTKVSVSISMRITQKHSDWLKKNNISLTTLFLEASKELGFKE